MSSISDFDSILIQNYQNFDDPKLDPYIFVERDQASFEKTLNVLGYIPFISSVTGGVRILSSSITLITSAIKLPLCAIADLFQHTPRGYSFRIQKHISYMCHSLLNIFRGSVEFSFLIGNIMTFSYDSLIGRISYPVESKI